MQPDDTTTREHTVMDDDTIATMRARAIYDAVMRDVGKSRFWGQLANTLHAKRRGVEGRFGGQETTGIVMDEFAALRAGWSRVSPADRRWFRGFIVASVVFFAMLAAIIVLGLAM